MSESVKRSLIRDSKYDVSRFFIIGCLILLLFCCYLKIDLAAWWLLYDS